MVQKCTLHNEKDISSTPFALHDTHSTGCGKSETDRILVRIYMCDYLDSLENPWYMENVRAFLCQQT